MLRAQRASQNRGRTATAAGLRWLSLVAALLLAASSLAQVAHFLLVPHAFCAEHGELLELGATPAELGHHDAPAGHDASLWPVDAADGHDHCQLLAREQREQLPPRAPAFELPPASPAALQAVLGRTVGAAYQVDCLSNAPKTSPPSLLG